MDPPSNFPRIYERSGDPERLRGGRAPPHQGRKVTCMVFTLIFFVVMLAGILVLSLRGSDESDAVEAPILGNIASNLESQTPTAPPTTRNDSSLLTEQVAKTTLSHSPSQLSLENVQRLQESMKGMTDEDIQDEILGWTYSNFRFYNVSSGDLSLATQLLLNRSALSTPQLLPQRKQSPLKRVMEAFAMNMDFPSENQTHWPQILEFGGKTSTYEEKQSVLRFELHKLIRLLQNTSIEFPPAQKVKDYLGIATEQDTAVVPTEEGAIVKDLIDLNDIRVVPMSRMKKCFEGEKPCGLNGTECYSERLRCDGRVDCSDFADEVGCPACQTFIDLGHMGISRGRALECDGHFDCPNGEDEAHCGKTRCQANEHLCPVNDICIPASNRCNFQIDCPDGSDEKGCVALWPQPLEGQSDPIASPYTSGILHWRYKGAWQVLTIKDDDKDNFEKNRVRKICTEVLLHDGGVLPKSQDISFYFENLDINRYPRSNNRKENKDNSSSHVLIDCGSIECGARPYSYQPEMVNMDDFFKQRIVGGLDSVPFDWPSVVAVYIDGVLLCGGSVIDKNWVLSAAHCYKGIKERQSVVEVIAGMSRVDSRSPYTQVRQVKEIIHHGLFNGTYLMHDMAMLYFEEPLSFNAKVNLVCLNEEPSLPAPNEHCITVGWGSTHEAENNVNNELQEVEVPIKSQCIQGYNDLEHQICGGFHTGGKDACQGDSGGPLFCASTGQDGFNRHYLAGIVSHGIGCARPETDGVYMRITYYGNWIEKILEIKKNEVKNRRYSRSIHKRSLERFKSMAMEKHPGLPFVYRVLNRDCPSGVQCDGGRCIPDSRVCDGKFHCMDRQDELNCQINNQGEKQYVPGYWDALSVAISPSTAAITTKTPITTTTGPKTQSSDTKHSTTNLVHPTNDMQIYLKPQECSNDHFTCKRLHECIPLSLRCDFNKDCLDATDEMGCQCVDYFSKNDTRICDGVYDCPDASDESDCIACDSNDFYCRMSRQCISQGKVCDKIVDCQFGEDEKHCITLVPYRQKEGIKIVYSSTGDRPLKYNHGYIALNYKGSWSPLCINNASVWNQKMNERVCQYQNSVREVNFDYVKSEQLKDPDFLRSPLRVEKEDGTHIPSFEGSSSSFSICETGVIKSSCSETTRCGVHPLYNKMNDLKSLDQMNGEGMFPWHVTLYQEGEYICGASLIHRNWIMTSKECSSKMNPAKKHVVARMGGYRNGKFLSPNEQVRQVIQFTRVPHTGISLGTFHRAVELGDYVNTICIPSSNWFPFQGKCVISGIDHKSGILNRGVKMTVEEICEINQTYDYSVCTKVEDVEKDVCMDNWSGTLSCLDSSNRYYVLGVYHTSNGGCDKPDESDEKHPVPKKFRSVSTSTARDAIRKIVGLFNTNESIWHEVEDVNCHTHRCPLGKCLMAEEVCDGVPHCEDMSDEDPYHCAHREELNFNKDVSSRCSSINSTHCACGANEFMCKKSHLCLNQSKFCNGVDDCGDASDEPSGCGVCVTRLKTLKPHLLCNGEVDCTLDGSDESAETCCGSEASFRCVNGPFNHLEIGEGCIERPSICNHCKEGGDSPGDCTNGADDSNCLTISARDSSFAEDIFGRPKSSPQGYLNYLAYGKRYLYCAGAHFYEVMEKRDDLRETAANILCRNEGFLRGGQLTFHETVEKHYVYSYEDEEDYQSCKLVYIVCRNRPPGKN